MEKLIRKKESNMVRILKQDGKIRLNNKGITLVALVITIIILLILAGISISLLTGDNGILTQAVRAKEETEKAQENEMIILEKYNQYLNNTVGISAKDISKLTDKTNVYGAEVKGYDDYINKKDEIWRLFYADEKNIYLIASDYISYDNIPTNDAGHKPNIGSYSKARKFFKYTRRL